MSSVKKFPVFKIIVILLLVAIVISLVSVFLTLKQREKVKVYRKRALVADSLSIDFPNLELDNYIVNVLKKAGYEVDFFYGSEVDLKLYSELTNYSLVILRVHGGKAIVKTPEGVVIRVNGLFTGLPWSEEYSYLKTAWLVARARPYGLNKTYLAVLPRFFEVYLRSKFSEDSVVIVASCYSLFTEEIADTLAEKGLSIFIGWEGAVSLHHMDLALKELIDNVFLKGMSWDEAVRCVNEELGPDPISGEKLKIIIYRR
ncbi:MAG: hypothetical protein B6U76_07005 [Desulfurococcales archaeon ex4484_217_2]|nr:MAG: hypothetical protein B6U76_07005 [Desulfurococcales archaeon ex4484_217_2]